jgi:hypothetical protein
LTQKKKKPPEPQTAAEQTATAELSTGGSSGEKWGPLKRLYYQVQSGSLCVSIWDKVLPLESGDRTVYSAAIQRSYRDGETRKWTNYLRESDLPVAAIAFQEAYRWLHEIKQPGVQQPLSSGSEEIPF